MRFRIVVSARVLACCALLAVLAAPLTHAQAGEADSVPYHKHHDTKNGHDHSYPDRGAIIRDVPKGAVVVNYAGVAYRFADGIWFEPRGPAFMVVAPPIGVIVPTLPTFSTVIAHGGKLFLYSNDTYYVPRPDVGGYEVVNDPSEAGPDTGNAAAGLASGAVPLAAEATAGAAASPQVFATPLLESAAAKPVETTAAAPTAAASGATASAAAAPSTGAPATVAPIAVAAAAPSAPSAAGSAPATGPAAAPVAVPAAAAVIYPKNGQSADQQARDRYECYRFAVAQSGFDPMHPNNLTAAARADGEASYERAQGVCLDAHGYAVH
jgi:hypothetical protein